ncbi:hypothetical protein PInf_008079 [Phytophthora infestans]|nr:hypothetical protein PInf_008079 [Phytophthora infestans]
MEPYNEAAANAIVAKTFRSTNLSVAGPLRAKSAVPDIFGPNSGRIKEGAEMLAKLGYRIPYVIGDAQVSAAHVANAIAYLEEEIGVESIGSYGYCLGVYVGAKQSTLETPVIKGHISFHPS